MTNLEDEGGKGAARVKFRNRRWWGLMLGSIAVVGVLHVIARHIWRHGARVGDQIDPAFAISASIAIAVLGIGVAVIYHRIIDEQEERAALWAYTIGFYALLLGSGIWFFLFTAKLVPLTGFFIAFIGSCLIAAAVQLWLQYR